MKRYLTPYFEGYTIGSKNLIRAANSAGVKSTVFSAEPWGCQTEQPSTYVLPALFAETFHADDLIMASYVALLPSLNDYDIIHFLPNLAGDIYASFIRSRRKEENRIIAHFPHPYHPFISSPFSRLRLSFLCHKVLDYIFCTTNFLAYYFLKNTRMQKSRIFCVPLPIDTNKYRPLPQKEKLREKHGISEKHVVAFVGQIEPVRGVFMLLQAFRKVVKQIHDIKLVISSPGLKFESPYVFVLKQTVKELKIEDKVILLPPQSQLEEIYNLADVVVFPYVQPYHYMDPPLTLLEAMASGALVLASGVGAANELIFNEENGRLVKPRSLEDLTKAIVDCVKSSDHSSLGVKARETIMSKYSINRIGATLAETYKRILESK